MKLLYKMGHTFKFLIWTVLYHTVECSAAVKSSLNTEQLKKNWTGPVTPPPPFARITWNATV